MKTIKQISDLTGISIRMLHHYDKIGLFKPSELTNFGYRLYDDESLALLQQILFFKELEVPLKDIKEILYSPQYDKKQVLQKQKELLMQKRNHLNELIALIEKQLNGGKISFKEFDMSGYYSVLEDFKRDHGDDVVKIYGSEDEFNKMVEHIKFNESKIAKSAVEHYGSIENYTESIRKNLTIFPLIADNYKEIEKLTKQMTSDLNRDPFSAEIQNILKQRDQQMRKICKITKAQLGDDYYVNLSETHLNNQKIIELFDKQYGKGASEFIGKALKYYGENNR